MPVTIRIFSLRESENPNIPNPGCLQRAGANLVFALRYQGEHKVRPYNTYGKSGNTNYLKTVY
jgi:hypothetical protein